MQDFKASLTLKSDLTEVIELEISLIEVP